MHIQMYIYIHMSSRRRQKALNEAAHKNSRGDRYNQKNTKDGRGGMAKAYAAFGSEIARSVRRALRIRTGVRVRIVGSATFCYSSVRGAWNTVTN